MPYRGRLGIALVALLVAALAWLALGQGIKQVVDGALAGADAGALDRALVGMLAIAAVLAAATWTRFYLMMSLGERVVTDLRRAAFGHLLRLEPAFFDAARTGEVISRLTSDATLLQQVIGFGLSMFVRNALMMAGAALMLFVTSWKLAALVLAGVPATLLPILLGRRVRRLSRANQDRVAEVSAYLDEAVHEMRTVQAYAHEDADRESFGHHAEDAYRAGVARIRHKAFLISAVMLIAFSAVAVILWIGGHDVLAGRMSAGELSAFVFYAAMVAAGAGTVAEVWGELQRAAGATERLMDLLATEPRIVAPSHPRPVPSGRGARAIDFEQVTFAYPARPDSRALERFTLRARSGERVALVGPSGAGKSTVFSLILRFYDPQKGAVRIDGIDVREMDPRALRRLVAVVPQEPVIFAASVLDNVRYGRPDASRGEVLAACEKAFAMEFIEALPRGLDTHVGERGVTLSGGQRQRLSIARALLADRPILLLDEATSSLDSASEAAVQRALETLESGRTTLAIAHRLATVQHADRIVVMEHGRIVAEGAHAELLREGGLYARLASLQFLGGDASLRVGRVA